MNLQEDIRVKPTSDYKLPEVFIVSSGRSGTTLLSSMMNATDQIFFPYESDFVARAYPFYGKGRKIENDDYPTLVKLFQMSSQPTAWNMTQSLLIDSLEKYSPTTLPEVFSVICRAFHDQKCTSNILWGIKAPVLIASLNRIVNVCPDAKIVHLVRDGRDVYLSYRKIHESSSIKFGPKGVIQSALYWVDGLKRVEEFIDQGNKHRLYELRYLDLMLNPGIELKSLCSYLNIGYSPLIHEDFSNHE
ncbi:MAG: sulfotransferase, partial [Leptolyngbya sp. SIO3F4]|nr:sulfotransferase [Leptolyngbya sp. SIO3F4]